MATNLPKLPDVERLSTNIIRVLGGNPNKFTLQGTNTYILGRGPHRILLDTGEGKPQWTERLSQTLKNENTSIAQCLLSHWHHDHILGVEDLLQISKDQGSQVPELYKNQPDLNPDGILDVSKIKGIQDGQSFSVLDRLASDAVDVFEVKAVHTPGHTKDHMCFVVTRSPDQSEVGCIFTGDNVLGHGTAVFEDLAAYLSSLAVMESAAGEGSKAYPGHGAVVGDARAKMREYQKHRKMREDEALNVLRFGDTKRPDEGVGGGERVGGKEWGSMEVVKVIYRDVPENLHEPAQRGLLMVLEKLKGEGKVVKTDGGRWRIGEKGLL